LYFFILICIPTSISADADGTRATLPRTRSTVALYTELDAECDQRSAIVVYCRPHLPRLPSPPVAVNNRPTAVAVYIALADGRRAVAKSFKVQTPKQSSRNKYFYFWRCRNFPEPYCRMGRGNLYAQNELVPCSCFDVIPACDRQIRRQAPVAYGEGGSGECPPWG